MGVLNTQFTNSQSILKGNGCKSSHTCCEQIKSYCTGESTTINVSRYWLREYQARFSLFNQWSMTIYGSALPSTDSQKIMSFVAITYLWFAHLLLLECSCARRVYNTLESVIWFSGIHWVDLLLWFQKSEDLHTVFTGLPCADKIGTNPNPEPAGLHYRDKFGRKEL
jgi:hypothetical protein